MRKFVFTSIRRYSNKQGVGVNERAFMRNKRTQSTITARTFHRHNPHFCPQYNTLLTAVEIIATSTTTTSLRVSSVVSANSMTDRMEI